MSLETLERPGSPQIDSRGTLPPRRHRWHRNEDDIRRWAELFRSGITILNIARECEVDPGTVSQELHRLGFTVTPGHHMVEQLPLKYSSQFIDLIDKGPDCVLEFVKNRVWGIQASSTGEKQLRSFCEFVRLHHQGVGVEEIARRLSCHRSTIAQWREGTDQPYLIRAVNDTLTFVPRVGWKFLPLRLTSGGSEPSSWIQVPQIIQSYDDVLTLINQIQTLEKTYDRAASLGLLRINERRPGANTETRH